MKKASKTASNDKEQRLPPVAIPLDFDRAVEGLLAVKPIKKAAKKTPKNNQKGIK